MLKLKKKDFVDKLHGIYGNLDSMLVTHYHGLKMGEITSLRKSLRESGAKFMIVKNTLSKLATSNTNLSVVSSMFNGPVAVIYPEDSNKSVDAIKKVVEFTVANKNLQIIGGVLNSRVVAANELEQIAKLPPIKELRGKIVGLLQAPLANIVRVVAAPACGVVRVIRAYSEK